MADPQIPTTPLPWGTDGAVPVKDWDTNSLWRAWSMKQIYLGNIGTGKFIPKIDDYVVDTDTNITYKVVHLNDFWIPTLERVTPLQTFDSDAEDIFIGSGDTTYRCYIDKSVVPHRMQVDARCYVNSTASATARVYRGNPFNGTEEIISLVMDNSGLVIDTQIPLVLSYIPNGQNVSQWYVPTAYTNHDIQNGEMLYIVFYDSTGAILSSRRLLASITAFTVGTDVGIAAVIGIALEGPLMSTMVPNRLEVPLNLTLNSINLEGVVHYNSGLPKRYPVNGIRFDLMGMNAFVPTQAGQHFPMVLKYNLLQNEVSYTGGIIGTDRFITEIIDVQVVDVENQLTVKLYVYPRWIDNINGYTLTFFLMNLDRNVLYDVTTLVQLGNNSPAFNPFQYGTKQQLIYRINLNHVNSSWRSFIHVQTIGITLLAPGSQLGQQTLFRVNFDPLQNPEFGQDIMVKSKFINQNISEVLVQSGFGSKEQFLEHFYDNTKPLLDPNLESHAPEPTHMVFMNQMGNWSVRLKISDYWNKKFTTNFPVNHGEQWFLKFVKETGQQDLDLSIAGFIVEGVNSW